MSLGHTHQISSKSEHFLLQWNFQKPSPTGGILGEFRPGTLKNSYAAVRRPIVAWEVALEPPPCLVYCPKISSKSENFLLHNIFRKPPKNAHFYINA